MIDCANGAAYKVAPEALWELGAEVIKIGVEPNGFNINKDCGSTAPERSVRKVKEVRADIGIALDGDADRVVIVDENGRMVDGDQLMAVIAESWHQTRPACRRRHRGHGHVQSRARALSRRISGSACSAPRSATATSSSICAQHGYNVGGEQSGHIVLSDYSTTGDGLVTALQLLAVVAQSRRTVSEICNRFEPLPQVLKNVRYKNGHQPLDNLAVRKAIDERQVAARQVRAPGDPPLRHRARDQGDGGRRRCAAGRYCRLGHRARADRRSGITLRLQSSCFVMAGLSRLDVP